MVSGGENLHARLFFFRGERRRAERRVGLVGCDEGLSVLLTISERRSISHFGDGGRL